MENNNIETKSPKYYNENVKKAIYKYRDNNRAAYNESQRLLYTRLSKDEEWKKIYNEKSKEANRKYREKIRGDAPPKPRGRPRKKNIEEI
jgi:hypothetical protein